MYILTKINHCNEENETFITEIIGYSHSRKVLKKEITRLIEERHNKIQKSQNKQEKEKDIVRKFIEEHIGQIPPNKFGGLPAEIVPTIG